MTCFVPTVFLMDSHKASSVSMERNEEKDERKERLKALMRWSSSSLAFLVVLGRPQTKMSRHYCNNCWAALPEDAVFAYCCGNCSKITSCCRCGNRFKGEQTVQEGTARFCAMCKSVAQDCPENWGVSVPMPEIK